MARLALVVTLLTLAAPTLGGRLHAQDPGPAFEIASVKHNTNSAARLSINRQPNRLTVTGAPLTTLILMAHNIRASLARFTVEQLAPSPRPCMANCTTKGDVLSARFDVTATVAAGTTATDDQQMGMLRRVLAERFKLKTSVAMRELPVYALTVARPGQLGAQLRPSTHNCELQRVEPVCQSAALSPGRVTLRSAGSIAALLRQIESQLDRPVVDRTELTGNFEWQLTHEPRTARNPDPSVAPTAPAIDAALQEQLGLRLVAQSASYPVMVIESVEMPTPD